MAVAKVPSITPESVQNIVDGTLYRMPSPRPGALGVLPAFGAMAITGFSTPIFIYCTAWSDGDRRAFWTGFLDRTGEFGEELRGYFVWFRNAFGLSERDGDFARAWSDFGGALGQLAELAWKVTVVAGVPPPMAWHPQRAAYARELAALGLAMSQEFLDGYKTAYRLGGVPRCTGRVLADVLRLVFEVVATKGLAKGVSAVAGSKVLERLPPVMRKIPERLKRPPTRLQLIEYITHDKAAALYGRGILTDIKPGQFLVRVERRAAKGPGNWFNGPFRTRAAARRYAQYLADLGERGIRQESALPRVWKDGGQGNAIEVVRIYEVNHPSPAISSVVAPQREGGTVMARPEHYRAIQSGKPIPPEYAGQGQQLSVPVTQTKQVHDIDLVTRVAGEQFDVAGP